MTSSTGHSELAVDDDQSRADLLPVLLEIKAHRKLIWVFVTWIVLGSLSSFVDFHVASDSQAGVQIGYGVFVIICDLVLAYSVFCVVSPVYGTVRASIAAAATVLPCVGFVIVLVLHGRVIDDARRAGVSIELFGTGSAEQIRALEARVNSGAESA